MKFNKNEISINLSKCPIGSTRRVLPTYGLLLKRRLPTKTVPESIYTKVYQQILPIKCDPEDF